MRFLSEYIRKKVKVVVKEEVGLELKNRGITQELIERDIERVKDSLLKSLKLLVSLQSPYEYAIFLDSIYRGMIEEELYREAERQFGGNRGYLVCRVDIITFEKEEKQVPHGTIWMPFAIGGSGLVGEVSVCKGYAGESCVFRGKSDGATWLPLIYPYGRRMMFIASDMIHLRSAYPCNLYTFICEPRGENII